MRNIAVGAAAISFVLSVSATSHASFVVWVYGDGESGRMLSELKPMLVGTGITAERRTPMETTSPVGVNGNPSLSVRITADVTATNRPNLIHIGYSAAAWSLTYCGYFVTPTTPEATWKQNVQNWARDEANAINAGVVAATNKGIRVLITKGPGVPVSYATVKAPLVARSLQQQVTDACMADAFFWVSYFLGGLTNAEWVDYSGKTQDPRLPNVQPLMPLDTANVWHWEQDGIHVSTDRLKYDGHDPPDVPFVGGYSQSFTVGTGSGQVPQNQLGAWRVAKNVLRAYQAAQIFP